MDEKGNTSIKLPPPSLKRVVDHNVVTLASSHCIILLRYISAFNVSNKKENVFMRTEKVMLFTVITVKLNHSKHNIDEMYSKIKTIKGNITKN